jgi:putative ABC transport system permease protein
MRDFTYAFRSLRQSPAFFALAVLTLALGICGSTAIFSIVNAVLLRPLPYRDPGRLFMISAEDSRPNIGNDGSTTLQDFDEWKSESRLFEAMTIFYKPGWSRMTLTGAEPRFVQGAFVTSSFFPMMGGNPFLGRGITAEDVRTKNRVVVLSRALWQERFGGSAEAKFWAPLTAHPEWSSDLETRWLVAGRLKPGVSAKQAQAEMSTIAARMQREHPERLKTTDIRVVGLTEYFAGNARAALSILFAAVLFVMLIGCLNVANLFLARGAARSQELAIRTALGAGRVRLVRLLFAESTAVAVLAGAIGMLFTDPAVHALRALAPQDIPRLDEAGQWSSAELGFAVVLCAVSVLIFELLPAWRIAPARSSGSGSARSRTHRVLVAAQFATALILLTGSGLLIRSFLAVLSTDPGFRPERVLAESVLLPNDIPAARYPAFYGEAFERIRALPGVEAVGATSHIFLLDERRTHSLRAVEGRAAEPVGSWRPLVWTQVSGDYFRAMGMHLLAGRYFREQDSPSSPPVAIINQTLARRFWPGQDPVGRRLKGFDPRGKNDDWVSVVGVVNDTRSTGLEKEPASQIYEVQAQRGEGTPYLVIRTNGDPLELAASVHSILRGLESTAILSTATTLEDQLHDQTARRWFETWILGVFSALALALAGIGIYGVMQYSISRRTHEIGIRMAIGARSFDVLAMVLREGLSLAIAGIGVGVLGAVWTVQLLKGMLYGVPASDPVTFAGVALLLVGIAAVASSLPARRAAKVDPMVALRYE